MITRIILVVEPSPEFVHPDFLKWYLPWIITFKFFGGENTKVILKGLFYWRLFFLYLFGGFFDVIHLILHRLFTLCFFLGYRDHTRFFFTQELVYKNQALFCLLNAFNNQILITQIFKSVLNKAYFFFIG